jgi:arylsulfatase A-like enzyme
VIGDAQQRREESPGAWVITDGSYLLRFVTTTPAGLYKDSPDGAPARYELYDLREDPGETRNLYTQLPQVAHEMERAFREQAKALPPPTRWRRDRWEEMMQNAGMSRR